MWSELRKHRWAYVVLVVTLPMFIMAYLAVWPQRVPLRWVSLALGVFYAGWGIVTHVKTAALTRQIVYEYLGIASLATLALMAMTL